MRFIRMAPSALVLRCPGLKVNTGLEGFLLISSAMPWTPQVPGDPNVRLLDMFHVKLTGSKQLTIEAFQRIVKMS